jgi:hypothetical protein
MQPVQAVPVEPAPAAGPEPGPGPGKDEPPPAETITEPANQTYRALADAGVKVAIAGALVFGAVKVFGK